MIMMHRNVRVGSITAQDTGGMITTVVLVKCLVQMISLSSATVSLIVLMEEMSYTVIYRYVYAEVSVTFKYIIEI